MIAIEVGFVSRRQNRHQFGEEMTLLSKCLQLVIHVRLEVVHGFVSVVVVILVSANYRRALAASGIVAPGRQQLRREAPSPTLRLRRLRRRRVQEERPAAPPGLRREAAAPSALAEHQMGREGRPQVQQLGVLAAVSAVVVGRRRTPAPGLRRRRRRRVELPAASASLRREAAAPAVFPQSR